MTSLQLLKLRDWGKDWVICCFFTMSAVRTTFAVPTELQGFDQIIFCSLDLVNIDFFIVLLRKPRPVPCDSWLFCFAPSPPTARGGLASHLDLAQGGFVDIILEFVAESFESFCLCCRVPTVCDIAPCCPMQVDGQTANLL